MGEAEEEDDDDEEGDDGRGKERDDVAIGEEELDLVDGDQIGDQAQKTGFWQPLVEVCGALEVNHVQLLFAACASGADKHLVSYLSNTFLKVDIKFYL